MLNFPVAPLAAFMMPFVAVDQVANTNVLRLQGAPAGHFPAGYEMTSIQHEVGSPL